MTPEAFQSWLAAMKAAGLIRSDAAAARLLGVTTTTIMNWKRNGARRVVELACQALLAPVLLMGPVPTEPPKGRQFEFIKAGFTTDGRWAVKVGDGPLTYPYEGKSPRKRTDYHREYQRKRRAAAREA